MDRKAMLATLFATTALAINMSPSIAQDAPTTEEVIETIANNSKSLPENRAYYLLSMAQGLLSAETSESIDKSYKQIAINDLDWRNDRFNESVANWAYFAASDFEPNRKLVSPTTTPNTPTTDRNIALANRALTRALSNLDQSKNESTKLILFFVASRLFKIAHNTAEMKRCNNFINRAIRTCEKRHPKVEAAKVSASSCILDAMANSIIPVFISNRPSAEGISQTVLKFSENDFKRSEHLKKRSLNIIDQLDATDHRRRKAHRDLVLWYLSLGKTYEAEIAKNSLFQLVGIHDDRILYPLRAECSSALIWWTLEVPHLAQLCGTG
ncbi:MAG: hypothetical protein JST44_09690 [Cyanobacteria bacterium SZAS LIN-5]|nr:hypothetical protein [Cyanobacteria bacterium SZAS LIN-5]